MLPHEAAKPAITQEQATRWLSRLARGMQEQDQTVFLIENLQPSWLPSRSQAAAYALLSRMLVAGFLGVILGLVFHFADLLSAEPSLPVFLGQLLFTLARVGGSLWSTLLFPALLIGFLLGSGAAVLDEWHLRGGNFWSLLDKLREPWRGMVYVLIYFLGLMLPFYLLAPFAFLAKLPFVVGSTLNELSKLDEATGFIFEAGFHSSALSLMGASIWGTRAARLRQGDDIQAVETLGWSWATSRRGLPKGFLLGFTSLFVITLNPLVLIALLVGLLGAATGMILGRETGWDPGRTAGCAGGASGAGCFLCLFSMFVVFGALDQSYALVAALFGVCGAIVGAIFSGLQARVLPIKTLANQGIRLSLKNAFAGGLLVAIAFGFLGAVVGSLLFLESEQVILAAAGFALVAGLFGGLWSGGVDWIHHFVLRLILGLRGSLPLRLARFLDYAADELHILQKVGGGYMFIHRSLLEYFAALEQEPAPERP